MELDIIRREDPEVADLIEKELRRQQNTIELIASENFTSEAIMAAAGTVLTNKYAEGKPENATTTAVKLLIKSKKSHRKGFASSLEWHMQTFSHIREHRQIWQYFYMPSNRVTKF